MSDAESGDHRVRVARIRRDKMARKLLDSVMACYAAHPQQGIPTVDEVIRHADVSRATFYKYFDSVDAAAVQLADQLVDKMVQSLIDLHQKDEQPFVKLTMGVHLFLLRSVIDPQWGGFVGRFDAPHSRGRMFLGITGHLAASREQGLVAFDDLDAARTFTIGAMLQAIRDISEGSRKDRPFVEEIATLIFLGLGVSRERSATHIRNTTIYIRGAAPDALDWWRDPWTDRAADPA